jgi:hypothetical protein
LTASSGWYQPNLPVAGGEKMRLFRTTTLYVLYVFKILYIGPESNAGNASEFISPGVIMVLSSRLKEANGSRISFLVSSEDKQSDENWGSIG